MNERIRLLAEQAGYYLYDLTETHECKTVETDSTDEWVTLEKFAQLILQECLTICQHNAEDDDDQFDLGRVHQSKEITHLIKKHFGVEE